MELKAKFDVTYMEAALSYLESLPEKVQDKIAYNISKSGTSCCGYSRIYKEDSEDSGRRDCES